MLDQHIFSFPDLAIFVCYLWPYLVSPASPLERHQERIILTNVCFLNAVRPLSCQNLFIFPQTSKLARHNTVLAPEVFLADKEVVLVQGGERLRECQEECRRIEGELAVSQLAASTAAANASSAAAQLATEQEAAASREGINDRELQKTKEALVSVPSFFVPHSQGQFESSVVTMLLS